MVKIVNNIELSIVINYTSQFVNSEMSGLFYFHSFLQKLIYLSSLTENRNVRHSEDFVKIKNWLIMQHLMPVLV